MAELFRRPHTHFMSNAVEHRYACQDNVLVSVRNSPEVQPCPAQLLGISKTGLSLACGRELVPSTEILIDLEKLSISCVVRYCSSGTHNFTVDASITAVEHVK
jgi:hypothetical protein